jgi:hypothetical protein
MTLCLRRCQSTWHQTLFGKHGKKGNVNYEMTIDLQGITSMLRDLSILTSEPEALETIIQEQEYPINSALLSKAALSSCSPRLPREGDLLIFEVQGEGAYDDMETLWGARVPLTKGLAYIGVLVHRESTKLLSGRVPTSKRLETGDKLFLVSQSGGIGVATGASNYLTLSGDHGYARSVSVRSALVDRQTGRQLNTLDDTALPARQAGGRPRVASVIIVGTGTDVGKTTATVKLIELLSKFCRCAAIKATGTGWYEDTLLHMKAGAFPALDFVFCGIPTTYRVAPSRLTQALAIMTDAVGSPSTMPYWYIHPELRGRLLLGPDVLLVECGGDLIWGQVAECLASACIMDSLVAMVVCGESAVAARGAVHELEMLGIRACERQPLFVGVPRVNPEGFYRRLEQDLHLRRISGIVDFGKPDISSMTDVSRFYAESHAYIMAAEDLVDTIAARIVKKNE